MEKSVFTPEYQAFLKCLQDSRQKAGLTQQDLAKRLKQTQSFVSKCERGERRVDLVELRSFCRAMNIPLLQFVKEFEKKI